MSQIHDIQPLLAPENTWHFLCGPDPDMVRQKKKKLLLQSSFFKNRSKA